MGLQTAALRFLVREALRKPFSGSVLTLGRQCVYATFTQAVDICRQEGLTPARLPASLSLTSNIPSWQGTPLARNISDVALFQLLGARAVTALDYSAFEGAELVFDLNQPVPAEWESRFDLVLDAGTMEHVFDVRRVLMNCGRLLSAGGRVVHLSPANNYVNHGFFQFSPTLFLDYYHANRFSDVRAYVAEQIGRDGRYAAWDLFQLDLARQPVCMRSSRQMLAICVAEKSVHSTTDEMPMQGYYQDLFRQASEPAAPREEEPERLTLRNVAKRFLPSWVRAVLRPYFVDEGHRKPWGSKHLGKLR